MSTTRIRAVVIAFALAAVVLPGAAHAVPPPNDDFDSASVIAALPFSDSIDTSEATVAPDDPLCAGRSVTVWYAFTPAVDVRVDANTFGSNYDTTLSVYTGTRGALTQIACNDGSQGLQSRVTFSATSGTTYFLMVGAFSSGPGGALNISVSEIPPPPPPPDSGTFLYMDSESGDYIGGGVQHLYTSSDSTINASLSPDRHEFSAAIIQGPYTHWWFVYIAAPAGQQLAEGAYEGPVRWPFQPAGTPGLSISGDGRGCNTLTGRFVVNEITLAPTGELVVFEADFEQHCEGDAAALFGRIRIENPPPPPDVTPPTLFLPGDITVEAPGEHGHPITYSAYATDDRDPSPEISCDPASGSVFRLGSTTVQCIATDDSGNTVSGTFEVTVLSPLELSLTLNSTGAVSGKTGVATLSGTMRCSRHIDVNVTGTLEQLFARRVLVSGYYSTWVSCEPGSTRFSVSVTGSNGSFGAGEAQVTMTGYGCELSCHYVGIEPQSVRLRGGA